MDTEASKPADQATVLVVEDELHLRELAERALRGAKLNVIVVADGAEALEVVESGAPIDVMVTDVMLPRMSGVELARRVCAQRPGLPVLLVSGYGGEDLERVDASEDDVLSKPYRPADLVARVNAILTGHRRRLNR